MTRNKMKLEDKLDNDEEGKQRLTRKKNKSEIKMMK